jgi:hypothetical protein
VALRQDACRRELRLLELEDRLPVQVLLPA